MNDRRKGRTFRSFEIEIIELRIDQRLFHSIISRIYSSELQALNYKHLLMPPRGLDSGAIEVANNRCNNDDRTLTICSSLVCGLRPRRHP